LWRGCRIADTGRTQLRQLSAQASAGADAGTGSGAKSKNCAHEWRVSKRVVFPTPTLTVALLRVPCRVLFDHSSQEVEIETVASLEPWGRCAVLNRGADDEAWRD
jgi:hypothetical protein